jgi:hypothetical protein
MTCRTRQSHMAGTSDMYPCPNIPFFLRVKTLSDFYADRELEEPLDLLYRDSKEGKNSRGVFTSIYAFAKTLEKLEMSLCKNPKGGRSG